MKSKMNIKSIVIIAILCIVSLFFINKSLAVETAIVNVETANLRDEASTEAQILEQLSINQEVQILEKSGEWYKVKYNNITGYLKSDLLKIEGDANANVSNSSEVENTVTNQATTTNEVVATEDNTKQEATEEDTTQQQEAATQTTQTNEIKVGSTYQIKQTTKLKLVPLINGTDIIEVKQDDNVKVTEIINGWVCVESQNTKGWIRQENIKTQEDVKETSANEQDSETDNSQDAQQVEQAEQIETVIKTQYVNSQSINVRAEASTSAEKVASLVVNTAVEVLKEEDGWSKVRVDGVEGYISTSLLSDTKQETARAATTSRSSSTTETQSSASTAKSTASTPAPAVSAASGSVVSYANQFIGCSYVYGGSTPSGFDCSGFTSYVYKQFGVSLSRTAAGQYSNGVAVSRSDLQPGDLIMFGKSGINHVGIYIGGGSIVHAANPSRGVTTDTINSGYYNNNYVGARRVM